MKKIIGFILILVIFINISLNAGAQLNPEVAVTGKIFLRPGMSKFSLTGSTASIFAGNSLNDPQNKNIKVYGSDGEGTPIMGMGINDTYNIALYGFDTSQNMVGTYVFSINAPVDSSNLSTSSKVTLMSVGIASIGIAFRPNYAGGVRFLSVRDFFNDGSTQSDLQYFINKVTVIPNMGTNTTNKVMGSFQKDIGGGMLVKGRFNLDYAQTSTYNDFN